MFTSLFRASDDRSEGGDFWFSSLQLRGMAGAAVTPVSAMRLSAVYACIRVRSESMAVLPFKLYRRRASGPGRDEVRDHWLYRLLAMRPNRFQDPFMWRQMLQAHLDLRGNAFCRIVEGPRGEVAELLPMHPDRVTAEVLDSGEWRYLHKQKDGTVQPYRRDQVLHLRGLSDDGVVGMNPIEVQRETLGGAMSAQTYANRFWANDSRPAGGWIEYPGKFADAEVKRKFRADWQEAQAGANRGKTPVLDMGMKYHELGVNNSDAQFLETRAFNVSDVARIFRVPPHMVGDLSRSTNNNIEHQGLEFWSGTMLPVSESWESAIEYQLLGDEAENLEPEFDFKRVLRGDSAARSKRLHTLVLDGIISPNEAREEEGYNPAPGGDERLVPQNMRGANDPADSTANPAPAPAPAPAAPPAPPTPRRRRAEDQADEPIASAAQRLARVTADRLARKELLMVLDVARKPDNLAAAYDRHAAFVAAALGVPASEAQRYCAAQLAATADCDRDQFEALARARLEHLALHGTAPPSELDADPTP